MAGYRVLIYDTGDGADKKLLEEIMLEADDKNSVIDKAHEYAFEKYNGVFFVHNCLKNYAIDLSINI